MNTVTFLIILNITLIICKIFGHINISWLICFLPAIIYIVYISFFVFLNLIMIFNIVLKEPVDKRVQKLEEILQIMEHISK